MSSIVTLHTSPFVPTQQNCITTDKLCCTSVINWVNVYISSGYMQTYVIYVDTGIYTQHKHRSTQHTVSTHMHITYTICTYVHMYNNSEKPLLSYIYLWHVHACIYIDLYIGSRSDLLVRKLDPLSGI